MKSKLNEELLVIRQSTQSQLTETEQNGSISVTANPTAKTWVNVFSSWTEKQQQRRNAEEEMINMIGPMIRQASATSATARPCGRKEEGSYYIISLYIGSVLCNS